MDQIVQPPSSAIPPQPAGEDKPRQVAWRGVDIFFTVVAGAGLSALLMIPIVIVMTGANQETLGFREVGAMGIAIYVSLCISGWFFAVKRRGATLRDAGFRPVKAMTLVKMVPVTIAMMVLTGIVVSISSLIFGDVPTAQDQVVGGADAISFNDFLWLFVLGAVAAPIAEEFLFRGLLYPLLRNKHSVTAAVAISAAAFAVVHFLPPLIPALLVMGLVLAILVERFQSLYPAMIVHALNNGVALIALYATIGTG